MATISFEQATAETPVEAAAEQIAGDSKSLAIPPTQQIAERSYTDDEDVTGEFTSDDQIFPKINIVQRTGELCETFQPGEIVLNKSIVIGGPGKALCVIPLKFKKQYQESLPYDDPREARIFDTAREVIEAGGKTEYDKPGSGYFGPIGRILFLVEKPADLPEHLDAYFPYVCGGKSYVIAGFTAAKTGYTAVGMPLAQQKSAKGSIRGTVWELTDFLKKNGGNAWYNAKLTPVGTTPQEVKDWIATLPL